MTKHSTTVDHTSGHLVVALPDSYNKARTRYETLIPEADSARSPSFWQAIQYLMGNHTIAERMFRHEPSVMLHAPLRTLIYADPDGDTKLAVDQPSLLFDSYGNAEIAAVGRELDALLVQLIGLLGGEVAAQLKTETAEAP
jgi:hypothetical protein